MYTSLLMLCASMLQCVNMLAILERSLVNVVDLPGCSDGQLYSSGDGFVIQCSAFDALCFEEQSS